MKVLDASFLIDYGNGLDAAGEYLLAHSDERFLVPAPIYTEYLLGSVHSEASTGIDAARSELGWCEVVEVDEEIAVTAAEVADEIGAEGPQLTAIDATVAAIARTYDGTVVAGDRDLTHQETKAVVPVDTYRH